MSITIDPTVPAASENIGGGLGASRIRNNAAWLQQVLGQAGTGPVTFNIAPFAVDTNLGLVTLAGNPTAALGAVTKQYIDQGTLRLAGSSGTNTYTITNTVPLTALSQGLQQAVLWVNTNTSSTVTLNVDGLGAVPIYDGDSQPVAVGALVGGCIDFLVYNSSIPCWQTTGLRLGKDLGTGTGYNTAQVVGFYGLGLSGAATEQNQVYQYNGTQWAPTILQPAMYGASTSSLLVSDITAGSNANIYQLSTAAPNIPNTRWIASVSYGAFYVAHSAGTATILNLALFTSPSLLSATANMTGGYTTLGSGSAPIAVGNTIVSGVSIAANTSVTFTLTGYAINGRADLSAQDGSSTFSGGILVNWYQSN